MVLRSSGWLWIGDRKSSNFPGTPVEASGWPLVDSTPFSRTGQKKLLATVCDIVYAAYVRNNIHMHEALHDTRVYGTKMSRLIDILKMEELKYHKTPSINGCWSHC